nr:Integrase, catalytic core [Ipomoea batatas]
MTSTYNRLPHHLCVSQRLPWSNRPLPWGARRVTRLSIRNRLTDQNLHCQPQRPHYQVCPSGVSHRLALASCRLTQLWNHGYLRRPNPKYFGDKFVNLTTSHPVASSIKPRTMVEAMKNDMWWTAMADEFNVLVKNCTWELVPRANHHLVGCKWVFKVKRKADGSVDRFKASLVAKGFQQEPGRDYFETFSLVVNPGYCSSHSQYCSTTRLVVASIGCKQCLFEWHVTRYLSIYFLNLLKPNKVNIAPTKAQTHDLSLGRITSCRLTTRPLAITYSFSS